MTTLILKKCSHCGEEKVLADFSKMGNKKRGECRKCDYILSKERKAKNQKYIINQRERAKKWKKNNVEKEKNIKYKARNKASKNLCDTVIIQYLYKKSNKKLTTGDFSDQLIECKRLQIKLFRLIREIITQQSKLI